MSIMKLVVATAFLYAAFFASETRGQDEYLTFTGIKDPVRARANLRDGFEKEVGFVVKDASLKDILRLLGEDLDVTVKVDRFAAPSLSRTTSFSLKEKRVSEVLREITQSMDLSYVVRSDTLVITTARIAAANPRAKVISIPEPLLDEKEALARALSWSLRVQSSIASRSAIDAVTVVGDSLRVVGHARSFHEVEAFLDKMSQERASEQATSE